MRTLASKITLNDRVQPRVFCRFAPSKTFSLAPVTVE